MADVTEWDALLEAATGRGYLWQVFGTGRHGPEFLAGVCRHRGSPDVRGAADVANVADVIVLTGAEVAHAYRVPAGAGSDVFAPVRVYWWYAASPVWTLRAVLTLPAPGDPDAPRTTHPAPPGVGVPTTARRRA